MPNGEKPNEERLNEVSEESEAREERRKWGIGILSKLKGADRYETAENWSLVLVIIGGVMLSAGIGLTVVNPAGLSAILAMFGAFIAFAATTFLLFVWVAKEIFKCSESE